MRQRRLILVLLLALASGAIAGYSVLEYLRERPTPVFAAENRGETVPVVVANRDLALGEVLDEDAVKIVQWPASALPTGYHGSVPEVTGRPVISEVRANEPILDGKLADAAAGGGLAPLIPPGMRAVSVRVDEVIGVAGYVIPDSRVDVILTMQPPGQSQPVSKIILQNLKVRGAGQTLQRTEDGEPQLVTQVTVLVDPEQAEKLVLASSQGQIQMALRNTLDLESIETEGERVSALFAGSGRTRSRVTTGRAAPSSSPGILEIYQGGVRTIISY